MADVFQEVDEIMRQERLQKFWNEYAPWIVAFVILTIVMTGAFSVYQNWNTSVQERQTTALVAALDEPDFETKIIALAADLRPDLRGVALMTAASKHVSEDNITAALPLYKKVASDKAIDENMRDLASLLSVRAALETQDAPDLASLKSDLRTLWSNDDSPWQFHAHMEMALLLAGQEGDYAAARAHLKELLAADSLPSSLYEKASALDHVYELKAKAQPAPAATSDEQTSTDGEG